MPVIEDVACVVGELEPAEGIGERRVGVAVGLGAGSALTDKVAFVIARVPVEPVWKL